MLNWNSFCLTGDPLDCINRSRLLSMRVCNGQSYNLNVGDKSWVTVQAERQHIPVDINTDRICLYHYNHFIQRKFNICADPQCPFADKFNSMRKCPVRMLKCYGLDESAVLNVHNQCYIQFDQRYSKHLNYSPARSNIRTPLSDMTNKQPIIQLPDEELHKQLSQRIKQNDSRVLS
jgi:hypothetical protein